MDIGIPLKYDVCKMSWKSANKIIDWEMNDKQLQAE